MQRQTYLEVREEERQIVVSYPSNDDEQRHNKRSNLLRGNGSRVSVCSGTHTVHSTHD